MKEMNEMTEREAEEYGALLNSAYPQPKDGLKDAVMARISAEKAARRRRRQSFIRWGSIAACLVIIAGAAFAVLPKVMSQKNSGFAKYTFDSAIIAEDCVNECEIYDAPSDEEENDMEADHNWYGNFALVPNLASEMFEDGQIAATNGSKVMYNTEDECASNEMPNFEENAEIADNDARYVNLIIAEADFDIDGDGEIEHCTITPGPTSGLYSIWFTVYSADGEEKYKDCFVTGGQAISFEENNGKTVLNDGGHYHGIEILDGHVSLPTDCEDCMINAPWSGRNK